MEINCGSNWGWVLILTLSVCATLYVGGGVAHAHKAKGVPLTPAALPHREFWAAGYGLVCDGAVFTAARVKELQGGPAPDDAGGSYEAVGEAAPAKAATEVDPDSPLRDQGSGDKPLFDTPAAGSGSDDSDDLVE